MQITLADVKSSQSFKGLVQDHFGKQLAGDWPEGFSHFSDRYFHQYPLEELVGQSWEDLFGCVYGWWRFIQKRDADSDKVKVFNPDLQEDGWESQHTVVGVLASDMPFLVDSLRLEIIRRNIPIHTIKSTLMSVIRTEDCQLQHIGDKQHLKNQQREAFVFIEINRESDQEELNDLKVGLRHVLKEVATAVAAYKPLSSLAVAVAEQLENAKKSIDEDEVNRSQEFLRWLVDGHFTFLGYSEFAITASSSKTSTQTLVEQIGQRQGITSLSDNKGETFDLDTQQPGLAGFYQSTRLLNFAKSPERSKVHRAAYPDVVVVKRFNDKGEVVGESRFIGLYTAAVYNESPRAIPLIRDKIHYVLETAGLDSNSHDGKSLRQVLETYPRDELMQSTQEELYEVSVKVAQINERHRVRLFMRRGPYGRFVSALIYVPRDLFNSEVRLKIQNIIGEALGATEQEFNTYFSESILARVHLVFKIDSEKPIDFSTKELQQQIIDVIRSWDDHLQVSLCDSFGEEKGLRLFNRYSAGFSNSYREDYDARAAIHDIELAESLKDSNDIAMSFYQPPTASGNAVRFKILKADKSIALSDVIPVLENMGLRVVGEHPYRMLAVDKNNNREIWLHDFELQYDLPQSIDIASARAQFQNAFAAVWYGEADSDEFNRLVLGARLSWREVVVLRAYAAYLKQTTFNFSQSYIAATLAQHLDITRNLVALFKACFDPRVNTQSQKDNERIARLNAKIIKALDDVDNLNEDRIIRRYLDLINGTLRTNFYQQDNSGKHKAWLSIKFSPQNIADIPEPRPKFEIFVYSPRMEGVHLRGGKVARGGLRWSDRLEDYRTEVLGLVKAQQVKNAVIVPGGAKGGFVAKNLNASLTRDEFFAEGIACYEMFISGLLDVTDNLIDNVIVPPDNVIRRDEDDPYLVVAADKGTATFSDIANKISLQYNHWLGDAFASGGSQGYDHKGMGITARGAWVGVQRHFKERGVDIQKEDFSVVGIGDMAGDVFGNGMLLSEHICLVAAFNHLHIFIDPNPDAAASFKERQRLFALPKSSWADYNEKLISKGGGIFSRSAKSIAITPQMQEVFAIAESALTPVELLNRLLKAPVDLVWNGGIGTYVKSKSESHADVGDKANDALRVNGSELRCQVFGEGGNLGMTQLGRVEFGLTGGASNTDFIDNSAGVDCSDHEVNIKILLNELVASGDLTEKHRNKLLAEMTDEVAELVLTNNYHQTQALSIAAAQSVQRTGENQRFIHYLESIGRLNRALEFLPTDEELLERQSRQQGLTRPELSVLVSYSKMLLKEALAVEEISEDAYIANCLAEPFPTPIRNQYPEQMQHHRLRKEIVATQLANNMVNTMGFTFVQRMRESTGSSVTQVAKAYVTARDIYQIPTINEMIEALDYKVPAEVQIELFINLMRRVRRATRWFLRNRRTSLSPADEVKHFAPVIEEIHQALPDVLRGVAKQEWQVELERLQALGVPAELASKISMPVNLYSGLGMVEAARQADTSIIVAAESFYLLGDKINLHWFANQIADVKVENYWQALARESYLDDLESQLRMLAVMIMRLSKQYSSIEETVDAWMESNASLIKRWIAMMAELQAAQGTDFAVFSVALRELLDLVQATQHSEQLKMSE